MTQEERDLLFKDLCSRLPYGVKLHCYSHSIMCIGPYTLNTIVLDRIFNKHTEYAPFDEAKPYLFPLSNMTEEQKKEYYALCDESITEWGTPLYFDTVESIDWLNAHHFDFRGLIPMGLAINAIGLNVY